MSEEPKKWDPNTEESWRATVASWQWHREGRVWRMQAHPCPRCSHTMDHEIPIGTYLPGVVTEDVAAAGERPPPAPVPVTVRCNCKETHEGRPEAFTDGCGPSVNLMLPLPLP